MEYYFEYQIEKLVFISIPILFLLFIAEDFVRLIKIPVLQNEPHYFGFSGCPKYFEKVKIDDNNLFLDQKVVLN